METVRGWHCGSCILACKADFLDLSPTCSTSDLLTHEGAWYSGRWPKPMGLYMKNQMKLLAPSFRLAHSQLKAMQKGNQHKEDNSCLSLSNPFKLKFLREKALKLRPIKQFAGLAIKGIT